MFLTIDSKDKRPIYRQVTDGIRALVARGDLKEGMALPSVRQLAGDLGVNLNTIAVAYRELQEEGLGEVRHGSGTVVSAPGARTLADDEVRRPLRNLLAQMVLGGFSEQRIESMVRQELEGLRQKGES